MNARQEALSRIVALAREHAIGVKEISEALAGQGLEESRSGGVAMRLFAYLGGAFIFSGIAVYMGMFWEDMNSAARVILTLGSGFALYVMALVFLRAARFARVVSPFLLISAFLQALGMFVAIYEWFQSGNDPRYAGLVVFGVMALQQALTFHAVRQAALVFTSVCFGALFFAVAFDLMEMPDKLTAAVLGASLLCIALAAQRGGFAGMAACWYFIGGGLFLGGAFEMLRHSPVEILYSAISCGVIYASIHVRSSALLWMGALSLLAYIGYFTEEHFVNSVGWPVALILLGIAFFGISAGAWRIKKKYL